MAYMRYKSLTLSNFSRAFTTKSYCYRPENEEELALLVENLSKDSPFLARGQGLSYSDCNVNHQKIVIDTARFNHLLAFDAQTGIVVCQPAVSFAELFLLHPDFIPPVLPGTGFATLGGGIANDIHGKNNIAQGTLGQHIVWLELRIGGLTIKCSPTMHQALFFATIGGLGLTGVICRVALQMLRRPRHVLVQKKYFRHWAELLAQFTQCAPQVDYQVAWLDLLNPLQAILSTAHYCAAPKTSSERALRTLPKSPWRMLYRWNMSRFNHWYARQSLESAILPLSVFNHPLDNFKHWPYLYGQKGLLQFQAVFDAEHAEIILEHLTCLITHHQALPMLAVLKYFTRSGIGLLSFVQPGFSIAIDFVHNTAAQAAILAMNQFITEQQGRIYLAKDSLLTTEQFQIQYSKHTLFKQILAEFKPNITSNLSQRLGITE